MKLAKFNLNQTRKNITLLAVVVVFAALKILAILISGDKNKIASKSDIVENQQNLTAVSLVEKISETSNPQNNARPGQARARLDSPNSSGEQQLLLELNARRTELEKKEQSLEEREVDLQNQSQALAEKLTELKTLTSKIQQVRLEKDNQYEARLEQLAQVYASIAPSEAAPMIGKLDEETALALLKRMPNKRMGQILTQMEPQRAVDLTKSLTKLEDPLAK